MITRRTALKGLVGTVAATALPGVAFVGSPTYRTVISEIFEHWRAEHGVSALLASCFEENTFTVFSFGDGTLRSLEVPLTAVEYTIKRNEGFCIHETTARLRFRNGREMKTSLLLGAFGLGPKSRFCLWPTDYSEEDAWIQTTDVKKVLGS